MKKHDGRSKRVSGDPDGLILDLPEVTEAQAPEEHPAPGPALAQAHAHLLLRSVSPEQWAQRDRLMNPDRFVL